MKVFPERNNACSNKCAANLRNATESNKDGLPESTKEEIFSGNTWTISTKGERVKNYDDLVRECAVDLSVWEPRAKSVKSYEVTYCPRATRKTDKEGWVRPVGQAITVPMFAVSASFEKKIHVVSVNDIFASVKANFAKLFPKKIDPVYPPVVLTDNVVEFNISDHHFGKRAWAPETGEEWNLDIARKSWRTAFSYLVNGTSHHEYEEAILVVGNDLLHVDNFEGTTAHGTRMDTTAQYQEIYTAALGEVLWSIRNLRSRGMRVRVVIVPGNHDPVSSFTIGVALALAFENDPSVYVDNSPMADKVYAFGKCLVAWSHAHLGQRSRRPLNLAVEYPDLWGSTEHREIHCGHTHHEVSEDIQSVIVRQMSALGGNDKWHKLHGYKAQRNAEAFMWNKNNGLLGTCRYVLPANRRLLNREAA